MLQITPQMRILAAIEPVDFRKGIDALAQLCRQKLEADPFSGCLFLFEKLATIQMVEVWIPMVDGRWLVMPRHTQPEPDVQALLNQIRITLSCQPPPRIKASQIEPKSVAAAPSLW